MEIIGVRDPKNEFFEVPKTRLAKLIGQGWTLDDPEGILFKQVPPAVALVATADTPIVVEPSASFTEDEAKVFTEVAFDANADERENKAEDVKDAIKADAKKKV